MAQLAWQDKQIKSYDKNCPKAHVMEVEFVLLRVFDELVWSSEVT